MNVCFVYCGDLGLFFASIPREDLMELCITGECYHLGFTGRNISKHICDFANDLMVIDF